MFFKSYIGKYYVNANYRKKHDGRAVITHAYKNRVNVKPYPRFYRI